MKRRMHGRAVPGISLLPTANEGFTTIDAVTAIALTGLLVAGMVPMFRAFASDLPGIMDRNREGLAFHHLACDMRQSFEGLSIPYWSAGPVVISSADRLDIASSDGGPMLLRNEWGIRISDGNGIRIYSFRSSPEWEPIADGTGRIVGIRLIHESGLLIDILFEERALGSGRR